MFGSKDNPLSSSDFTQLFLQSPHFQSSNIIYNNYIPPCPPCYCSCPIHSQYSNNSHYSPMISPQIHPQYYNPYNYSYPTPNINNETQDENIDYNDNNDNDNEEYNDESDSDSLHIDIDSCNEEDNNIPMLKWAEEDELLIEISNNFINNIIKSFINKQEETKVQNKHEYGILYGKQIDSLNIKITKSCSLYSLNVDNNNHQNTKEKILFTNNSIEKILSLIQKQNTLLYNENNNDKEDYIIGWYYANYDNHCLLNEDIVTQYNNIHSNISNEALIMIIDIKRTKLNPEYPCIEFYDLRKISKYTQSSLTLSTIAFTFPDE